MEITKQQQKIAADEFDNLNFKNKTFSMLLKTFIEEKSNPYNEEKSNHQFHCLKMT